MKSSDTNPSKDNDYDGNICLCGCGKELDQTNKYYVKKYIHGHNVKYIKRNYPKGKTHPNWKGGGYLHQSYWYIRKPNHPFSYRNGYIAEHRLIYEHYLKILFDEDVYIPSNVDIHHIDSNTQNNSLINLEALPREKHISLEHTKDKSDRCCLLCRGITYINKKTGYEHWFKYLNGFICNVCYSRILRNK